ncbi:tyrosinase [Streptomyces albiflavescens]|uniref:Tyrosinase n=2 Tax=Streptomyces albiflavescens TaxID=1623582 RepID=A0A917XV38_9ACTN|nr:tyrosinase cofactor [Streptomyces albiflavescens]GGN54661.1 tyrosinase [Streptomyces albiflavescens]
MRGLLVSAFAVALTPVVAASRPPRETRQEDPSFDEVYRGRHILGTRTGTDARASFDGGYDRGYGGGHSGGPGGSEWHVTVDGKPLQLMRRADGSYLSMVDHYESYPTALAAVRAAVDELGPSEHLRGMDAAGSDTEGSSYRHGVHA